MNKNPQNAPAITFGQLAPLTPQDNSFKLVDPYAFYLARDLIYTDTKPVVSQTAKGNPYYLFEVVDNGTTYKMCCVNGRSAVRNLFSDPIPEADGRYIGFFDGYIMCCQHPAAQIKTNGCLPFTVINSEGYKILPIPMRQDMNISLESFFNSHV